jgi:hypothetical protein
VSDADLFTLEDNLGASKAAGEGEHRFLCPFCPEKKGSPDTKHHLYVNPGKETWICFRCDSRGHLKTLLRRLGIDVAAAPPPTALQEILQKLDNRLEIHQEKTRLDYPCEVRPVIEGSTAWGYLISRGVHPEIIPPYQLVWGSYRNADRIFFPTFSPDAGHATRAGGWQSEMTFWVARSFIEYGGDDYCPRYTNPLESCVRCHRVRSECSCLNGGTFPASIRGVFNLSLAVSYPTLVITEGPISAMVAGPNAVGTHGKLVSEYQRSLLLAYPFEEYVVALDGDAQDKANDLAEFLLQTGKPVYLVPFKSWEDPGNSFHLYPRETWVECSLSTLFERRIANGNL